MRQLRRVLPDRSPLGQTIARTNRKGPERLTGPRPARSARVWPLAIEPERPARNALTEQQPSQPEMVGVLQRIAGDQRNVAAVQTRSDLLANERVIGMAFVLIVPIGKPARSRSENGARAAILLSPCASRLPFGLMTRSRIPSADRSLGRRVASEHCENLNSSPCPDSPGDGGAEREDSIV